VARGGAEYITRLPKKEYVEWIWDHAAGRVVIEEAGGVQTDTNGDLIDYGLGAKMDADVDGLLMSSGGIFHDAILDAYREQEEERNSRKDGSE
jgi:3'(2'), 5'-bisphosphate nucleotidase